MQDTNQQHPHIHVIEKCSMNDLDRIGTVNEEFGNTNLLGIVLFYASWNHREDISKLNHDTYKTIINYLVEHTLHPLGQLHYKHIGLVIQVDQNQNDITHFIDLTKHQSTTQQHHSEPIPSELPVIALFVKQIDCTMKLYFVTMIRPFHILRFMKTMAEPNAFDSTYFVTHIVRPLQTTIEEIEQLYDIPFDSYISSKDAIRIFIAGDRSSVGKSSICLGILGCLLDHGYTPHSLAYIKPATQSESIQLIQLYCEQHGIHCVPIGPLVYYRGFTRAYLAGETESTSQLLSQCQMAVDRIARGKRIVLIDGVGFPSVGSICGTSNADVARICGYPTTNQQERRPLGVVLVGGSGVGAAVDAFNLNATYFEQAGIPVLGGIFNKLSDSGYYSLENCKTQITEYFRINVEQNQKGRRPFGFVPLFTRMAGKFALDHVHEYIQIFRSHVNIDAILVAAQQVKESDVSTIQTIQYDNTVSVSKRIKISQTSKSIRSRDDVESQAIYAGAAPSA